MTAAPMIPRDIIVTQLARQMWIERVDSRATPASAAAAICAHARVIRIAARFRCRCVILPRGFRLILDGLSVVTVLGRGNFVRAASFSTAGAAHAL